MFRACGSSKSDGRGLGMALGDYLWIGQTIAKNCRSESIGACLDSISVKLTLAIRDKSQPAVE